MSKRPSDFMVVLAVAMYGQQHVYADEVCGQLKSFGFQCTAQQVAAWISRIAREDLPAVEHDPEYPFGGVNAYRLTQWGWNELRNRGFKALGMPVAFPESEGTK